MRKTSVSIIVLLAVFSFCGCRVTQKNYYAYIDGKSVSFVPYIYYASENDKYYSLISGSFSESDYISLVNDVTERNFLTYYIVTRCAEERGISLSESEISSVDDEYRDYSDSKNYVEGASEKEIKDILGVYYLQEKIRASFEVSEQEITEMFSAQYTRYKYCLFSKYSSDGTLYPDNILDEIKKRAYNAYSILEDGTTDIETLIALYSDDYVRDLDALDDTARETAEEHNTILVSEGFLIDEDGFHEYSVYPVQSCVTETLKNMKVTDIAITEDSIGYWIIKRFDGLDLIDKKRTEISSEIKNRKFSQWLDSEISRLSYEISSSLISDYSPTYK